MALDEFNTWTGEFNSEHFSSPRDEVLARVIRAEEVDDKYVALPCGLVHDLLNIRQCGAKTVVNGNRESRTLIEVQCERMVDPRNEKHVGMHKNGKVNW